MEFNIKSGQPQKQRTACLILGVFQGRRLSPQAEAVDEAGEQYLSGLLRRGDMEGRRGQSLLLHQVPGALAERVLLIGCGKEKKLDAPGYLTIIKNSIAALKQTGAEDAVSYLAELDLKQRDPGWRLREAVKTSLHTLYEFNELKTGDQKARRLRKLAFTVPSRRGLARAEAALREGQAIGNGIKLARDLGNRPGNICTPTYLARRATELGKGWRSLTVEVLDEAAMKKLGMGSLLSVAQGSKQPAKLITLEYRGAKKSEQPVALVGKGVTFDTGGISLKPPAAMDEMKYDMCGAASVLGTLSAVAELELPINVVGVIPAVENMPGGRATKPGDIFTSLSGQTVEVLNTDAEGRLILCDALTYSKKFRPAVVIDIATLTGACVIALGKHATGLMSNHQPLAADLLAAGEEACDRAWQLPIWDEYQQQLHSNFADMANIGGRDAGTITAACFLSRFTEDYHWAHLDIAGTAWLSGRDKGATGRPIGLLTQYILNRLRR